MTDPAHKLVPVVQADREAAANLLDELSSLLDHNGIGQVADLVRDGEYDEHEAPLAFARHRLAAAPEPPLTDAGREALVAGPVWREAEEESECWTAEVQAIGGHYVVATVHGGTKQEAEARQCVILAALAATPTIAEAPAHKDDPCGEKVAQVVSIQQDRSHTAVACLSADNSELEPDEHQGRTDQSAYRQSGESRQVGRRPAVFAGSMQRGERDVCSKDGDRISGKGGAVVAPPHTVGEEQADRGSFACPICGETKPHHHTAAVVDAYQNKRAWE